MSQAELIPTNSPTFSPVVHLHSGRPATTSLEVARIFGKRHDNVLRDVEVLLSQLPENSLQLNFEETFQAQETPLGRKQTRMFTIYRDGFMLLVMGYTGKKALAMKLAYIEAFNRMEAELAARSRPLAEDMVLPPADAPISPSDQSILQSVVKAKIASLPEEQRGKGLFPQIWSRFNNHFRLGSYKQLPQCRMAEAVTYLMGLELPADRKEELPPPLPQDLSRDSSPCADALRRVANLRWGMASAIDVLRLFCDPRYHPHQYDRMSQEVAINLYRTAHGSLVAAYNALEAAHRLQHAVLPSVERS